MARQFADYAISTLQRIVEHAGANAEAVASASSTHKLPHILGDLGISLSRRIKPCSAIDYTMIRDMVNTQLLVMQAPEKVSLRQTAWELVWTSLPLLIKKSTKNKSNSAFIFRVWVYLEALLLWSESQELAFSSIVQKKSGDINLKAKFATSVSDETKSNVTLLTPGVSEFDDKDSLFLSCLDDVLQITTIGFCSYILDFFSENISRIKNTCLSTISRRRQLLRITTILLGRTTSVLYPDVVSALLKITAGVFRANDKSILNVKSTVNLDNQSVIEVVQDESELNEFYKLLWGAQSSMLEPKRLLLISGRKELSEVIRKIEIITERFAKISMEQNEHLKNTPKEKLLQSTISQFSPKFLTSRELFDAQITDTYFRKQILVEFLLFFETLLFYSETKVKELIESLEAQGTGAKRNTNVLPLTEHQWITDGEAATIKSLRCKVIVVLSRIPPKGSDFLEEILNLVKDEHKWMEWKTKYCNPDIIAPKRHQSIKPIINNILGVSTLQTEFGTPRFNRLKKEISQCPIRKCFKYPSVDVWTQNVEGECRGEIDEEYKLTGKEHWKWQTYRMFVLCGFKYLTQPETKYPFRDLIRRYHGLEAITEEERRYEIMKQEEEENEEKSLTEVNENFDENEIETTPTISNSEQKQKIVQFDDVFYKDQNLQKKSQDEKQISNDLQQLDGTRKLYDKNLVEVSDDHKSIRNYNRTQQQDYKQDKIIPIINQNITYVAQGRTQTLLVSEKIPGTRSIKGVTNRSIGRHDNSEDDTQDCFKKSSDRSYSRSTHTSLVPAQLNEKEKPPFSVTRRLSAEFGQNASQISTQTVPVQQVERGEKRLREREREREPDRDRERERRNENLGDDILRRRSSPDRETRENRRRGIVYDPLSIGPVCLQSKMKANSDIIQPTFRQGGFGFGQLRNNRDTFQDALIRRDEREHPPQNSISLSTNNSSSSGSSSSSRRRIFNRLDVRTLSTDRDRSRADDLRDSKNKRTRH